MRLISLTSDNTTFHPVTFNREGVSLIVGRRSEGTPSDDQRTYNGVGKSLLIKLIHFCLGSNSVRAFSESIPDWEFTLRFEHAGNSHEISRNTSNQRKIFLDGIEYGIVDFNRRLASIVFRVDEGSDLTFRTLIKRYIRPVQSGYNSFDQFESDEQDYHRLLATSYVLGLNTDLIRRKSELRSEIKKRKELRKQLESDGLFARIVDSATDPGLELQDIKDRISHLEDDLASFTVAENYNSLEAAANETRNALHRVRNEIVIHQRAISRIEQSLAETPDISSNRIASVFEEAQAQLGQFLRHSLENVERFHRDLILKRGKHLANERQRIVAELDRLDGERKRLSEELDSQLAYLGSVRALDEFVQLNNRLSDLRTHESRIEKIMEERKQLSKEILELNAQFSEETVRSEEYLEEIQGLRAEIMQSFRSIAKRFYPDSPAGLSIETNEGENKVRFNIDAHIQNDASTGINSVKIFAFDMTLLTMGGRHCEFLVHDNQLYSDIDPRQRMVLFRVAEEEVRVFGGQYIATVNEDQIEPLRDLMGEEEYAAFIERSEVLRLEDHAPEAKLLGVQVDMHY